jgi:hypothetical protein
MGEDRSVVDHPTQGPRNDPEILGGVPGPEPPAGAGIGVTKCYGLVINR